LDFAVLGPLEVRDQESPVPVGAGRERALLALLLLNANEVVSSDRLIDELWGECPPATVAKALQVYISRLRKALGPDRIVTVSPGYSLRLGPDELDLHRFERLSEQGRRALERGDARGARELLGAALALWRGAALADLAYERFAQLEAARLDELRLAALEARGEADLTLGRHGEVTGELERLVAEYPLRERLRGQLMLALYRSGRQAEALEVYRMGREALVEELGLEPGAALRELEGAILNQDAALEAPSAPTRARVTTAERKVASVLFAELGASAEYDADPERLRALLDRVQAEVASEVEIAGGHVESRVGSSLFSTFGALSAHEDHAERAIEAAHALRERLDERFGEALRLGIGVDSGELLVEARPDGSQAITGAPLGSAAQLAHEAAAGEIRLGSGAATARARGVPTLGRTFVGRDEELELLAATFDRLARGGRPHLVTIVGDAGVGKSRLVEALRERLAGSNTSWYVGRCPAYGRATTYRPFAEILRERLDLGGDDPPDAVLARLGGRAILGLALGLDTAPGLHPWEARERLHDSLVDVLGELVEDRPAVVIVEDLHWADEALLELLDRAIRNTHGPLLLVGTGRPELVGRAPTWGGGRGDASRLWLEPLSRADAERMLSELAGPLPGGVPELVLDSAEGNPFFVEEALRSLVDQGVLRRESGGWTATRLPDRLEVPGTITGVITARIDLLPVAEKAALQAAAVIGRSFWDRAVRNLSELPPDGFRLLEERDFVRRLPESSLEGQREFVFKHALTRDVAYSSLTAPTRAKFHAGFADWLAAVGGGRDEHAGRVATHYAEAAAAGGIAVRANAVKWLRRAGQLASSRFEMEDAAAFLRQAAELEPDSGARTELWRSCAVACAQRFDMDGFRSFMERALEAAPEGRPSAELYAELALEGSQPYMWRHPPPEKLVEDWIGRALAHAEPAGRARATALIAQTFLQPTTAGEACREGRAIAEQLDEPVLLAHAYQAQAGVERVAGRLEPAAEWVDRELGLAPSIADPNKRGGRYFDGLFAYLRLGRVAEARSMAEEHDALSARLTQHHEVHAAAAHLMVETAACRWQVGAELSARAEAASAANADTPCQFNWRSLLMAALACAELGDAEEAKRLEHTAAELVSVGGPPAREPALLRLALARGDLAEVERLLAADPGPSIWDVDYGAARLDALTTLDHRDAVEAEAAAALALGGYVEPFALRALGAVRDESSLLERATARFEAFGLDWRARETRALEQREGRRRSAAPIRRSSGQFSP
jgi:DNA-binding SARP family transcriptional activator